MPIPPRYPLLSEMRVEQVYANQVRSILETTTLQLGREISKMDDSTNPITRLQAEAQYKALQAYGDQDWADIEKSIAQGRKVAAAEASKVVSRYENQLLELVMDESAMKALAKSEAQRAAAGVDAAVKRMQGASAMPLSRQVYDTRSYSNGLVRDKINQALAAGWSQKRLAKEVQYMINPNTPGGVSYAANRLARTEINNAFHASAAKRYEDSPIVEMVDWHLSSSHPEGDICDSLAADGPYKKKSVPQKPHPHCYCFITPVLPTDEEFIENLFAGKYADEPWVNDIKVDKVEKVLEKPTYQETAKKISAAKTPEGVGKALKEHVKADKIQVIGFTKSGIGVRSLDEVKAFANSIARQMDETPNLRAITAIRVTNFPITPGSDRAKGNSAMAWVQHSTDSSKGAGTVNLSNHFDGSFLDAVQRSQRSGWFHIPDDAVALKTTEGAVDYITTHEVGHLVDRLGMRQAQAALQDEKGDFKLRTAGSHSHAGHNHHQDDHSGYAHTNEAEALAEAYATSRLYPEYATAAEKALVDLMDEKARLATKLWEQTIAKRIAGGRR